jgi:hypothetical protein
MELSPFIKANSCSATQESPSILWTPHAHFRVHERPSLVPILSQMNPVHASTYFFKIHFNLSSHLCLRLPSGIFPSCLPTKTSYVALAPTRHAWCKSWSSLSWNSLQRIISSLVGPHILLSTLNLCSSRNARDKATDPHNITPKITVLYRLF